MAFNLAIRKQKKGGRILMAVEDPNVKEEVREHQECLRLLSNVELLKAIPDRELDLLAECMAEEPLRDVGLESSVLTEGTVNTDAIFVVKSGKLAMIEGGKAIGELKDGDCFGERSILLQEPCATSVVAKEPCKLHCITAAKLKEVFGSGGFRGCADQHCTMMSLSNSVVLSSMPHVQQRTECLENTEIKDYEANTPVDAVTLACVIVITGEVLIHGPTGERVLRAGERYEAAGGVAVRQALSLVVGQQGARLATLKEDSLGTVLDLRKEDEAVEFATKLQIVRQVPIFRHIPQKVTYHVVETLKRRALSKGDALCEQGAPGDGLFILEKGEAELYIDGKLVGTKTQGDWVGERAILLDESRGEMVRVSSEQAIVWTVDANIFKAVLTDNLRRELVSRLSLSEEKDMELKHLSQVQLVSARGSNTVRIVSHGPNERRYVLKRIKGDDMHDALELKKERRMMECLRSVPFVVKTVKTFERPSSLYLVSEFMVGGSLAGIIKDLGGRLEQQEARFYIAALVLILEVLQDMRIIHRDVKPENLLLDAQGYPKLNDFDAALQLKSAGSRTFTVVGTAHYMAPEVARGRGYGKQVDLWSLGVLAYELLCGRVPFGAELDLPPDILAAVAAAELAFPDDYQDEAGRTLIRALLERDPKKRLTDFGDIQHHRFFNIPGAAADESGPVLLFENILGREVAAPVAKPDTGPEQPQQEQVLSDAEELAPEAF